MPTRAKLDAGLQDLKSRITNLGTLNEHALLRILDALETGDYTNLPQAAKDDLEVGILCAEAEHQALRLLILQQPLAGWDMRFLTASLYITDNMKRMSNSIAECATTLLQAVALYQQESSALYAVRADALNMQGTLTDVFILRGLQLLGKEVYYILRQSTLAFANRDASIAHTIESEHDLVEMRYAPLCQDIMTMQAHHTHHQQSDPSLVQRVTYLLWVAHKLAEIATSITAICQRTIYIVEGS
jgi:phosphate transport system protein